MSRHSKLSASSMYRWLNCPASVRLSEGLPRKTSEYAEEGTRAHEYAAKYLLNEISLEDIPDKEMQRAIEIYARYVVGFARHPHFIEKGFRVPGFHPDFYGTCDFVGYNKKTKTLTVADFKYGKGHKVKVENNSQLLYYALGAVMELGFIVDKVVLAIVQPRLERKKGNGISTWEFDMPEVLLDFAMEFLDTAAKIDGGLCELRTGDWCYFCPALQGCPAIQAQRNDKARDEFS